MNAKASKIIKYLLSVALAVVLLYFAFRSVNWTEFVEGLRSCKWLFILISMALGLLAFTFRALRWQMLLKPLDRSLGFWSVFNAVCIGNAANCAIPGAGEFVRCGIATRKDASYDKVLGTIVLERVLDLVSIALIIGLLAVFKWDEFGAFLRDQIFAPASSRLNVGMGWLVGAVALLGAAAIWVVVHFKDKNRLCGKLCGIVTGLWAGVKSCLGMERKGLFVLYTVTIWVMYAAQSWCILSALPGFAALGALDALFLMAAGSIASVVPVPGGFGAYHYIVSLAVTSLYGLPWEAGILFATLSHESQTLTMLLSGLASYVSEAVRHGRS